MFESLLDLNRETNFEFMNRSMLDFCWEKLHTGHWQQVNQCWRVLYSFLQILHVLTKLDRMVGFIKMPIDEFDRLDVIGSVMPQLIIHLDLSLIMGLSILDGFASKLVHKLHNLFVFYFPNSNYLDLLKRLDQISADNFKISTETICLEALGYYSSDRLELRPLDRIESPTLEAFSQLMHNKQPFIVTKAIQFWPACSKTNLSNNWTLAYWFKNFAYRLVPIEIGSKYTDLNWGQELITIGQFIERFVIAETRLKGYLAQYQLFLQIPELGQDVYTPDYCMSNGIDTDHDEIDINVWFGPANTISPLHHDGDRANLLSQIDGFKLVILYPASETSNLYQHPDKMLHNTSQVDMDCLDFEKFPDLVKANGFVGILGPGEMLYIPPHCWHYVRSLSISFSVNFWWNVTSEFLSF